MTAATRKLPSPVFARLATHLKKVGDKNPLVFRLAQALADTSLPIFVIIYTAVWFVVETIFVYVLFNFGLIQPALIPGGLVAMFVINIMALAAWIVFSEIDAEINNDIMDKVEEMSIQLESLQARIEGRL